MKGQKCTKGQCRCKHERCSVHGNAQAVPDYASFYVNGHEKDSLYGNAQAVPDYASFYVNGHYDGVETDGFMESVRNLRDRLKKNTKAQPVPSQLTDSEMVILIQALNILDKFKATPHAPPAIDSLKAFIDQHPHRPSMKLQHCGSGFLLI